ncbi:uncharacterized protein LY89DRAFT_717327 [Mollisia scopiformis]|uniref:Clr5 domain-containing protein n=1 Tax=Mollisia scopiformis TaxID=149040 RepID=A0A194XF23_MOLSC|nr:uncharacterized protein LY89DRAFT_717327 [Mollisia scopiformis]KUJ18790.1 hypothetical protein LY89DRAFT_717327 [Mollisia scopiformis]
MNSSYDTLIEEADGGLPSGGQPTSQLSPSFQPLYSAQAPVLKNFNNNNPHNQFTHPVIGIPICAYPENITSLQMEGSDTMMPVSGLHQSMQAMFGPLVESQPSLSLDQTRLIDVNDQDLTCDQNSGSDLNFQMGLSNPLMQIVELPQPPQAWSGPSAHLFGQLNTSHLDQSTFGLLTLPQNALGLGATPSSLVTPHQLEAESHAQQSFGAAQPAPRKRAPKASTMSAEKWEPAESRIRQLFLDEERSYKEVMDIVNQEFGFTATERQYKAKVLQMKLKRNVEASKRRVIVRHIQHRKQSSGKVTKLVRVQGHRKSEAIIQKWMKEYPELNRPIHCIPPSPLPSQISLRTGSHVASPNLSICSFSNRNIRSAESPWLHAAVGTPVERLLSCAQGSNTMLKSEQCGAILNDFQHILSSGSDISQCPEHDSWSSVVEEDLINIRNRMNMTNEIRLENGYKDSSQLEPRSHRNLLSGSSKIIRGFGSRRTPYGRVTAVFWQNKSSLQDDSVKENQSTQSSIAAQIAIHPNGETSSPFRIVLDLDTRLNPLARITYQAMIPNNSEIFTIIEHGELKDLTRALESRMASLSDRDENGRSLLNYAITFSRVNMLKFLLETGFDPDAIEPNYCGDLLPLSLVKARVTAETSDEFELDARSECFRLMLQADADIHATCNEDISIFEYMLWGETSVSSNDYPRAFSVPTNVQTTTLKYAIRLGGPLVHPRMLISDSDTRHGGAKCSPLMILASESGYRATDILHILEKAIILLKWGVEISCRDLNGNTVLHRVLCCHRRYTICHGLRPFLEPGELLKIFIAAGADIYALNNAGRSASRTARNFGREKEWSEALQFCGFDPEEVMAQTMPKYKPYMGPRHTPTLTFGEYCRTWDEEKWAEKMSWDHEADSGKNEDGAYEPGLKEYYWEKGQRWGRRERKQRKMIMKREAKARSKAEAGSSHAIGGDCCCNEHDFPKAPDNMEDEDESENEDSTDDFTEYSSDYPLETWGYSSGDDSGDDLAGGHYYEQECPSEARDDTDHSIAMDSAEHITSASTASKVTDYGSINNDTQWQPMDPPLYADEAQSRAGSWRYTTMEGRRNEDEASMNGVNFFQKVEAPFDGAFQTEFDAFMTVDQSTFQYESSQY